MKNQSANWSISEAARVFAATWRGDKGGFTKERAAFVKTSGARDETIHINGRTVTALIAGNENAAPVIFLHGSPGQALEWRRLLEEKQDKYRLIALDRPGYGPSAQPPPDLVKDTALLGEVLKKFTQKQKAILVGHSLGGGVAAALAAAHPDLVQGLVLVGASLDPALEKAPAIQKLFLLPPFKWALTRSINHSNAELIEYAETYLPQVDIKDVRCPVAVVHSHDDPLVSYKNAAYIRENFINAAFVNIISLDSGGHFLAETRLEEIWRAISR